MSDILNANSSTFLKYKDEAVDFVSTASVALAVPVYHSNAYLNIDRTSLPENATDSSIFLSALHESIDTRSGMTAIQCLSNGISIQYRTFKSLQAEVNGFYKIQEDFNLRLYPAEMGIYTALNIFHGPRRTNASLRALTGFYVDVDLHSLSASCLAAKKEALFSALSDAFLTKSLPSPTMIVDTGRGFAVYYMFNETIPCFRYHGPDAKKVSFSEACARSMEVYNETYAELLKKFELTLAKTGFSDVIDHSVTDYARLVRIPGTWNASANAYATLLYYTEKRTSLREIASFCHTYKTHKTKNIIDLPIEQKARLFSEEQLIQLAKKRAESLIKLQHMRQNGNKGTREKLLFVYLETVLIYLDKEAAAKAAWNFNASYNAPLSDSEVRSVIRSLSSKRHEKIGRYKFTNKFLQDFLNLTKDEILRCGFFSSTREVERDEKRKEKAKKERKIASLLREKKLTRKEIAEKTGVSLATVQRIARKRDLLVYSKKEDVETSVMPTVSVDSIKNHQDENIIPGSVYAFLHDHMDLLDKEEKRANIKYYGKAYMKAVFTLSTITGLDANDPVSRIPVSDFDLETAIDLNGDEDAEKVWFTKFYNTLSGNTVRDIRFAGLCKKNLPNISDSYEDLIHTLQVIFLWQKKQKTFYYFNADAVHKAFKMMTRKDIGYLLQYLDNLQKNPESNQYALNHLTSTVVKAVLSIKETELAG